MRWKAWASAAWMLACMAFLAAGAMQAAAQKNSLVHKRAPEFVRMDLAGNEVDLRAFRGKVVLLNFWATWCAPCQVELPRFAAWQSKYGPGGLQIIAVSMDDDASPVRETVGKLQLNFPVVMGDEKLGAQYGGVLGLPVSFLIDRHGVVRARLKGETDLHALERRVNSLLKSR
jgi:cytochrome c biogenesis protein CcmG, thiol:disulfide interchange protein DsbE